MTSRRIILLFVVLEVMILIWAVFTHGFSLFALQTVTRFSGKLCLALFSAIFILSNKPHIIRTWLSEKYYVLFAIVNGIHLVEYLLLLPSLDVPLLNYRIIGGVMAYTFIFAMPIIHHYATTGSLSIYQFLLTETVFLYFIWLVFFLTYLPRVQGKLPSVEGSYAESVAILGWISTMMGIKLTSHIHFRKMR
jgi:hypothetical protein